MNTACKWEELQVETYSSSNENDIVRHSPDWALALVGGLLLSVILLVDIGSHDRYVYLGTNTTVEPWKPHPVTESVGQNARVHISSAKIYKGCEKPEQ